MKRLLTGLTLIVVILFAFSSCDEITDVLGLNSTPVANAGEDQEVDFGVEVMLDGSGSSDADGDPLTYSWTLNSYPSAAGPNDALISGATNKIAYVTPQVAGTYVFDLEVSDEYGSSSDSVTVTVIEQQAPATPTGLSVGGATESSLDISWSAVDGADDYTVYRDTSSTGSFSASVYSGTSTSFTDTGLLSGVRYWYKVMASNATGDSALSTAVSGTTTAEATEAPVTPGNLTASSVSSSSVTLTWDMESGATSYQLERSDDGTTWADPPDYIYNDSANTYTDTSVVSGTTYYYRVTATNSIGSSPASTAIEVTTDFATPTGLAVDTATQNSLTISWSGVTGADGYTLARSDDGGSSYTDISTSATSPYLDDNSGAGLASGTVYYYKVKATNSDTGAESAYTTAKSGLTKPATPAEPTFSDMTESSLTVEWTAITGASKYYVYSDKTAAGDFSDVEYSGSDLQFTDSGLTASTEYNYQVRAWNSSGYSGYSVTATGSTLAEATTAPDQPTGLAVDSTTSSSVTISWTQAANAAEYAVYSDSASPGGDYAVVGTTTSLTFTESGLASETAYTYYVVASNSRGDSTPSTTVTGTTLIGAPATPSAPTVTQSTTDPTGSLDITFATVTDADSYTLYRSTSTDASTFEDLSLSLTGTDTITHTDSGLNEGTKYYYKVQAFNAGGGSGLSTYGSATTASTLDVPTGLQVSDPTVSSLTVTWGSTGADQYLLYRDMFENGDFTNLVHEGADITYTDTGLASETTYYYKVKAVVASSVSDFSTTASGTTLADAPTTPTGLTVGGETSTSLYVSWNEVSNAAEYTLASDTGEILYTGPNSFFNHEGLTPETEYGYKVLSTNSAGSSPFSGIVYGTTTAAEPAAPATVTATALSNASIEVSWGAVTEAESYKIYRQREDGVFGLLKEVASDTTTIIDDKLPSGTLFTYRVKASNVYGDSPYSQTASTTTLGPQAPQYIAAYDANAYSVEVSWDWVDGVDGYYLYRTTNPDGTWEKLGPIHDSWIRDGDLVPETEYFYKVTAFVGTEESTYSPTESAWTDLAPTMEPMAPSFWHEYILSDEIGLRWDYVTDAAFYRVYESPDDGSGTAPSGAWTQVYEGANTKAAITGLTPNTQYWFAVVAVNDINESSRDNNDTFWTSPAPTGAPTTAPVIGGDIYEDEYGNWIDIWWDWPENVEYFILERSDDGGGTWMEIYSGPNTGFYEDGLAPGIYDYRVAGANNDGQGPWSDPPLTIEVSGTGGVIIIVE